jgi:hypothetical protein
MRSILRLRGALFLPALLGLSACATYNPAYGGLPFPFPGDDGYGRRGDYGDYGRTNEWRRLDNDANRYANDVDRAIGISSSEERAVSRVVRDRARQLLQRTHPQEHRYVYPFPRNDYDGSSRSWWSSTDRSVERVLSSQNRREYRAWVNGDYYGGYNNRDGYYNGRYDDDYRGRRYEEDRRRYDPVYNDARRAAARREAAEIQRRREEEARRRYDDGRRAEERRRQEIQQREQRERQADARRRQQEAERRQSDARRNQDDRRRRQDEARPQRESDRRQDARRDGNRDRDDEARDRDDDRRQSAERGRGRNARPQRGN